MEVVHLQHPPEFREDDVHPKVMALGYFDGVHIGHKKVIQKSIDIARHLGTEAAVMTFHPHPSAVIKHLTTREDYITPPQEKVRILEEMGIERLYFVTFDHAFSQLSPQTFVDDYLAGLGAKHVVAGYDFTYGKKAQGTMENIATFARNNFDYTVISKVNVHDEKVSTTKIRGLILDGEVDKVPDYLGRYYQLSGEVVHGDKRGRELGFPTANVQCDEPYVIPNKGVYAVKAWTSSQSFYGVASIGERPTFYSESQPVLVEVYLFHFTGDLYGERLTVEWYQRLRDEVAFSNARELVEQMNQDKEDALRYFKLKY
ncbi:bifunctional riboflavin kinase/FAD synthetase [Tuberibacillus sp. Marseille-P3662]|uniref:bifunctional riboflavin kinase/FAD synthetase n=1 Tax=Tuberibacillus sp. Marseille-P3662 TaxID=1965358 RepID=UPI000A1C87E0|nr:bifunctional riboflavin kinase/FAD synthetase [Tuberibacillus sp. Marseille-P3662]